MWSWTPTLVRTLSLPKDNGNLLISLAMYSLRQERKKELRRREVNHTYKLQFDPYRGVQTNEWVAVGWTSVFKPKSLTTPRLSYR